MGVNGQCVQPSEFACHMYAFVGVLSMVYAFMVLQVALLASLASATAGMALLAPLVSYRMETQCMSIIEVIKLSGLVHGVENQDSHAKMGVNGHCVQPLC